MSSKPSGDPERPAQREDQFGYQLHITIAGLLPQRGDEIREIGRRNLARMRQRSGSAIRDSWLDEWENLLNGSDDELTTGMLQIGERGNDLRSMSPFAGVLDQAERLAALHKARNGQIS